MENQQYESNYSLTEEELTKLPTISIVVPNYNGGQTIGATLKSLIDQNYPKLEIIVVDGASTDNSVEEIINFESHISWWVSEKDSGQSSAINKGFSKCSGEILNWLCSDDLLAPSALYTVGKYFAELPDIDILVGRGQNLFTGENLALPQKAVNFWLTLAEQFLGQKRPIIQDAQNPRTYIKAPTLKDITLISVHNPISQPSCFYRRRLINRTKAIDESYHYAMDTELWNYFQSQGAVWKCIDDVLSISIQDGRNKTSTGGYKVALELERIYETYVQERIPLTFWHRNLRYPLEKFMAVHTHRIWIYIIGTLWVAVTLLLAPFYGFDRVWHLRWKRWT
ncbi:glycosyltransferase [Nostoc sp. UHCC 0702]|nr:glycosyltransferase [Nostoc sp. UHCC 0702]